MSGPLIIKQGEEFALPVDIDHPLFEHQSFRLATDEEIMGHPYFGPIAQKPALPSDTPVDRDERLLKRLREYSLILIRWQIGPILELIWGHDIEVQAGAVLTYHATWTNLKANNLTIRPGGTLRVTSPTPRLPATLNLECNALRSEP
jgi:hypothetical protein